MLELKSIYLHNWHRFEHQTLACEGSLFLTGHNGSGKSTVLDAIQLVLVAEIQRMRFNSSAQEKSSRNLDSYVRGKIGEDRYLRPHDTVGYVALQFAEVAQVGESEQTDGHTNGTSAEDRVETPRRHVTVGCCIEASDRRPPDRGFFIIESPLPFNMERLCHPGSAKGRSELKKILRSNGLQSKEDGKETRSNYFDGAREYQQALLAALGKLPPRFLDVFVRALTFQPIRDIRLFVEQWLLDPSPLTLVDLNTVTERLADLRIQADRAEKQLVALQDIAQCRSQAQALVRQAHDQTTLAAVAHLRAAEMTTERLQSQKEAEESTVVHLEGKVREEQERCGQLQQKLISLQVALQQNQTAQRLESLTSQIATIQQQKTQVHALESTLRDIWQRLCSEANGDHFPTLDRIEKAQSKTEDWQQEALSDGTPPKDRDLRGVLDAHLAALTADGETWKAQHVRLSDALARQMEQVRQLQKDLDNLTTSRKVSFPAHLQKARDLLSAHLGQEVTFLCEHIEVTDESWHDAIEAILGNRRFTLVLSNPAAYSQAQLFLRTLRRDHGLFDVSVLNSDRVVREARPGQNDSLARHVFSESRSALAYAQHVLGGTTCVDEIDQLQRHNRAVTRDCVLYSEWSTRALDMRRVRPWRCGARALTSQIEELEKELRTAEASGQQMIADLQTWERSGAAAREIPRLAAALARLEDKPSVGALVDKLNALEAEKGALDTSDFQDLLVLVQKTRSEIASAQKSFEDGLSQAAAARSQVKHLEEQLTRTLTELDQHRADCERRRSEDLSGFEGAAAQLEIRVAGTDHSPETFEHLARTAQISAKSLETKAINARERLVAACTSYNISYDFTGLASETDDTSYNREYERIRGAALPEFKEAIAEQSKKAEEELREHILHRLRERILAARQALDRLNRGLKNLQFRGESYRFRWYPGAEVREFYDLVMDSQAIGSGALKESSYYQERQQSFERFYDILTMTPQNDTEQQWRDSLTDYRTYLNYDIEVTHASGQVSRLSRIMGQTSGGETQTPFYIAIAASFLQIYEERSRSSGISTPRLVVFDEAFSKMDQDRIAATVDVFHSFGLQVITATPLERCEYLAPRMQTSLVLTAVGDCVHVEPYANYSRLIEDSRPNWTEAPQSSFSSPIEQCQLSSQP
jgi:uncharacterized protein YPO0396